MTIRQAQYLLLYLGYDPGEPDGIAGAKTAQATAEFQREYGLTADGVIGVQTEKALIGAVSGTMLKVGTTALTNQNRFSRYFSREEFRCQCGGRYCNGFPVEPTKALLSGCDKLREAAAEPLYIVDRGGSGVRCKRHNTDVCGAANSNHLYGKAADLHPSTMTPRQLYDLADKQLGQTGELGLYSWGVHFAPEGNYSRFHG